MPSRRLVVLASLVAVVLVVAIGASRPSIGGAPCPERVWSSALQGLTDQEPDACTAQSLDRIYAVAAGLMGLVLVTGLLGRRD
ncbi:MAG: hypothetical protein M3P96_13280 [Actinomycetota bacterium]|nr:hypothetical protein [Actinomycetota bacterium]